MPTKRELEAELAELKAFMTYLDSNFPSLLMGLKDRFKAGETEKKKGTDHYGT